MNKKKKKPTTAQIQAEIAKLKEMKPTVQRSSAFGDNVRKAIDAFENMCRYLSENREG